jgi:hypothetical protein
MRVQPKPTARRRRRTGATKKTTPTRRRRTTRRRRGLSEHLSASGLASNLSPVLMGVFGSFAGLLISGFMKNTSPLTRLALGAGAGFAGAAFLKAPNFAAGLTAGLAMPAIGELLNPPAGKGTMEEGYLMEDLPEIIDDGLGEPYMSEVNYLSEDLIMNPDTDF